MDVEVFDGQTDGVDEHGPHRVQTPVVSRKRQGQQSRGLVKKVENTLTKVRSELFTRKQDVTKLY